MTDHSNEDLTYENAPKRLFSIILGEARPAERKEIEILFMRHCIGNSLPSYIIDLFKEIEMKRILAVELYRANVVIQEKDKYHIMHLISDVLGVHNKTVKIWVGSVYNNENEETDSKESPD